MFLACWLFWATMFWLIAYTLAKTHGASFKDSMKVIFRKNPREVLSRSSGVHNKEKAPDENK